MPILPMTEGRIERRSHDYYRHGTTTLFAALDIATGKVTATLKPKHRHQEFLAFLKQIERTYRGVLDEEGEPVAPHLVMDNYFAHKHKNVRNWLADNCAGRAGLEAGMRLGCGSDVGVDDLGQPQSGTVEPARATRSSIGMYH